MRHTHPDPTSLVVTRWLSLLVAGLPLARGAGLLASGTLAIRNARDPGPANPPDFDGLFLAFGGCAFLTLATPLLAAAIGVWLRKRAATIALAVLCVTAILLGLGLWIMPRRSPPTTLTDAPSAPSVAYALLLAACAVASTKAAIDLYRRPDQPPGFPPGPPPLPAPLPDFNIVDDVPADHDS
jgi:hypothetical protein